MTIPKAWTRRDWLRAERSLPDSAEKTPPLALSQGSRLSVALVYPNSYHVGMSSLGYQLAWRAIQDHPLAHAERFFMDSLQFGSLESGRPLGNFDVIAFSAAYEMDDPSILDALDSAGIPLEASERNARRSWPLVLMGGVLVSVNRLPLYPFMDVFVHGEAEVALSSILDALSEGKPPIVRSARERLEAIERLPGVEVTAGAKNAAGLESVESPAPPRESTLQRLDGTPCATQILTPHTEFSDMVLIDLARGCPHHCTFCWIGHNTPPYRVRRIEDITQAIERWTPFTDRFGLVSSAVGAHPQIDEICRWIMDRGLRVSYSSLRVEEVTPTMLEALARGGQKTITIAPEAGNPRVRRLLGKMITDDQILEVVERAMSLGVENIKQYFMIGIPSETEEEAMDIIKFSEKVRAVMMKWGTRRGRLGNLGFNLGIFVPKPSLPLNHIEPTPLDVLKRRLKKVVAGIRKIPNTRLMVSSPDLAAAQAVLSMGDVSASQYVRLARETQGDWRSANRLWKKQSDEQFESRRQTSRIAAETIRMRTGAAVAP